MCFDLGQQLVSPASTGVESSVNFTSDLQPTHHLVQQQPTQAPIVSTPPARTCRHALTLITTRHSTVDQEDAEKLLKWSGLGWCCSSEFCWLQRNMAQRGLPQRKPVTWGCEGKRETGLSDCCNEVEAWTVVEEMDLQQLQFESPSLAYRSLY